MAIAPEIVILRENLQEIFCALHHKEELDQSTLSTPDLFIPNLNGTRIYNSSMGWGRLWRIFFNIIGFFDGGTLEKTQLRQALDKTHSLFKEILPSIQESIAQYQKYLDDCVKADPPDETPVHQARATLTSWYDSTQPFLRLIQEKDSRISRFFKHYFPEDLSKENSFFTCPPEILQACKRFQRIISLEGHLRGPLPIKALTKIIRKPQEINDTDRRKISDWIGIIEETGAEIGVRAFHHAMRSVVEFGLGPNGTSYEVASHLSFLITTLKTKKFSEKHKKWGLLFVQEDPIHLQWRNKLTTGSIIKCNSQTITLGPQINPKITEKDNNKYFEVQGDSTTLVWISINRLILGEKMQMFGKYRRQAEKNKTWDAIKVIDIKEIDTNGSFALVERLLAPVTEIPWTSKDTLSNVDAPAVSQLATMLSTWIGLNKIPRFLSIKHVQYSLKNQLKFSKIPDLVERDFNVLADFALGASQGNSIVYRYLVEKSGMKGHKLAPFYEEVVSNTIMGIKINENDAAAKRGISDQRTITRAKELSVNATLLKTKCQQLLQTHLIKLEKRVDNKNFEKILNEKLVLCYKESKSVGIVWPGLEKDVIESFLKSFS